MFLIQFTPVLNASQGYWFLTPPTNAAPLVVCALIHLSDCSFSQTNKLFLLRVFIVFILIQQLPLFLIRTSTLLGYIVGQTVLDLDSAPTRDIDVAGREGIQGDRALPFASHNKMYMQLYYRIKQMSEQRPSTFILKLHRILQNPQHSDCIYWTKTGESFIVSDVSTFTERVLPHFFRHRNYCSFERQLHMYDFAKISPHFIYHHPFFRRNCPLHLIRRKQKKWGSHPYDNYRSQNRYRIEHNYPVQNNYCIEGKINMLKNQQQHLLTTLRDVFDENKSVLAINQIELKIKNIDALSKKSVFKRIEMFVLSYLAESQSIAYDRVGILRALEGLEERYGTEWEMEAKENWWENSLIQQIVVKNCVKFIEEFGIQEIILKFDKAMRKKHFITRETQI